MNCDIVRDLLPLYQEGMLSPDSVEFVEGHLKTCPDCRAERELLRRETVPEETEGAAEKAAENVLAASLHSRVEPYGTVSSTLCTSRQRGDTLEVTLTAECLEEIGTQVPIYVETANESDR